MKTKYLFVTGKVNKGSAQYVRYCGLLEVLKDHFDLILLSFNTIDLTKENTPGYDYISFPSAIQKLAKYFNFLLKRSVFPDVYIMYLPFYRRKIKEVLDSSEIKGIIVGVTPFSLIKLSRYIKRRNPDLPLYLDLSDPFSENALITKSKRVRALKYEMRYLPLYNTLFVVSQAMRQHYQNQRYGSLNVEVIEQGVSPIPNLKERSKRRSGSSIKLIYAGGFYRKLREPYELYKALEKVSKNVSLDIYGSIRKRYLLKDHRLIQFHGIVPYRIILDEYQNSDIIVLLDNAFGIHLPGKTLECMMISKPLLFIYENEASPTYSLVSNYAGTYFARNKAEEISKVIEDIIKNLHSSIEPFDYSQYTWNAIGNKMAVYLQNSD